MFNLIKAPIHMMTNPLHLGLGVNRKGQLKKLPATPNCVSSQTNQKKKRVDPLPYCGTAEQSKAKLLAYLTAQPRVKVKKDRPDYLYVVYTSKLWRFKDDVEFYFDDDSRLIQFRSGSRLGYSDMGVNRQRYNDIKAAYLK